MISEFCADLPWDGFAIFDRAAESLAVCLGVDEEGYTNSIHDVLTHSFL